jgi:group I intron endonuclease
MYICRALVKHGYQNFSLTILEYCEVSDLLIREKHYWDIFTPSYNIGKDPTAPMSGRNHSEETKKIISDAKKGKNNPMYGKNHSPETKQIMSDAKKGENHPMFGKTGENHPRFGQPRPAGAGKPSQTIEVFDLKEKTTTYYNSISEAARALNLPNFNTIRSYIKNNQQKPYKKRYTFNKI